MNSHPQESQKKLMVIGCGHSHALLSGCGLPHPADKFITVDMNPARKPDILQDIRHIDLLRNTVLERFTPVSALIFEYCPLPDKTTLPQFKQLLDTDGYMILVGAGCEILDQLDIGHQLWFGEEQNTVSPHIIVIIPKSPEHSPSMPELDPAVTKYLCTVLHVNHENQLNSLFQPVTISAEFKAVMPTYRVYLDRCSGFIPSMAKYDEIKLFLTQDANHPPTKQEIMGIIHTYSPGFFRRNFGEGKTEELTNLLQFLESKNDPLSNEDLLDIANMLIARQKAGSAILTKFFWTPDNTETTRIFTAIYARIHAYLFSYHLANEPQHKPPVNQ